MTAWVLFFAGVTSMRSLTRSRGRVTVVLFMKLSAIKITIDHMTSIRTSQAKKSVLMKAIEKWSPRFPGVFLLEKRTTFGYIGKESKNEIKNEQNSEFQVCWARERARFVAIPADKNS
jgi:hypothetical protein